MLIARLIAEMPDWETRLDAANAALAIEGGAIVSAVRLGVGVPVIELHIEDSEAPLVLAALDRFFGGTDHLVSDRAIAIPHVFVSDMDSTMIGQECIDELADYAGLKARIAAITERAMRGELDFEAALRERVGLLAGLAEDAIAQCLADRIRPNPGARVLVETLKAHGCETVLVTGGFHHFADPVAAQIGFDRVVGNRLEVKAGKLTGNLHGPIIDSTAKRDLLEQRMAAADPGAQSLAIGDGANDIPMIARATHGFAYRAKPAARAAASGRIESGDLSAVLSLLGIAAADFSSA
jgi:phosphoserine phosphatase